MVCMSGSRKVSEDARESDSLEHTAVMIDDVVVGSPHNCRATCRDMPEGQVSRPEQRLQVQRGVGWCECGCAAHGASARGSFDATRDEGDEWRNV